MDLASYIAEAAVDTFKKECETNTCDVIFKMHNRYSYTISVVPMAKHIIIRYKTLEYKISREDTLSYDDIVNFLVEAIEDDIEVSLNCDIEWNGYWPDHDEEYHINNIVVKRHGENVFSIDFKRDKFESVLKFHLKCLRNLN